MKKLLSVLLTAALLASFAFPFAHAEEGDVYLVTADPAVIYKEPDILSDKVGQVSKGTYVTVTEFSHGFGKIFLYSAGISGWVETGVLADTTPSKTTDITGLSLTKPTKLTYIEDEEELDLTGLKVYAVHKDGSKTKVTGYKVASAPLTSVGTKSVRVEYSPAGTGRTFSASFTVKVNRVPLTSLSVKAKPTKTKYLEHEKLDLTGLKLTAKYSDGRADRTFTMTDVLNDPDFTVKGCHSEKNGGKLEAGSHKFTVTYKYSDITTSFSVSVTPRTLINIRLKTEPDSMTAYSKTAVPSIRGLVLEAEYDNGEKEDVSYTDCEVECDPASFVLGKNNPVYVHYGDFFLTLMYRLALNETVGIRVIPPRQLSYIMGQKIDLASTAVQLMYADGTLEDVTDFKMTEIDPYLSGSQNVIVTYGEYSDVFTISITPYYQKGDADGSGEVEVEDARIALRCSVGLVNLTGLAFTAADVDESGTITPADSRSILRASVGLEKLF